MCLKKKKKRVVFVEISFFFPQRATRDPKKFKKKGRKRSQEEEEETHTHTKHSTERDIESEKKLNQNTRALLRAVVVVIIIVIVVACAIYYCCTFQEDERGNKQTYKQGEKWLSFAYFLTSQV